MTQTSSSRYTGTDNLEAMEMAHRYNDFLVNLVNRYAPRHGCVLDFGAGTGTYTRRLLLEGRDIICVEVDDTLREALKREGLRAHSSLDDIPDHSCDFIYSLNVLEHIEDDARAATELFRVLKPGGLGLIYVPAMQGLFSAMDVKVGHFRRYDRPRLKSTLHNAGFDVRKVEYVDSIGYFATLAYKLFGSKDGSLSMRSLIFYDRVAFPVSRMCDLVTHHFFGKNLFALVQKPEPD